MPTSKQPVFLQNIISLFKTLRHDKHQEYKRVLPFGEYFSDRWDKAKYLNFGADTNIYDSSYVYGDVKVGEKCWIGPFTILDGAGASLTIGNNVHISAGVQIYTHDTLGTALGTGDTEVAPVKIGDFCYLGPNVVIAKGVTIGSHVVIGANSFVNSDVPSGVKLWGNPARIVKESKQ